MTIDFRDQEMWTTPLDSFSETKGLGTSTKWQEFTMSATAPTGTARPVFHTRLTFQAAADSTVDIDDVVMSVEVGGDECMDGDIDGYGTPACGTGPDTDCDDGNFFVNPGIVEDCTNGIDDNCNLLVDADDPACQTWCFEPGESCRTGSDCCSGNCSKGKPSSRKCQ